MEFDNYSITGDDPMSPTSLLHGAPHSWKGSHVSYLSLARITLVKHSGHNIIDARTPCEEIKMQEYEH